MSGANILIGFVGVFGFLPLGIVLYKRRLAGRIISTGQSARAIAYNIYTNQKHTQDVVSYRFTAANGNQYTGSLTCRPGLYKVQDVIEVFYLPDNPKRNTVKGAWKSKVILIFVIVIAVWILYMMYKLYQMENLEII